MSDEMNLQKVIQILTRYSKMINDVDGDCFHPDAIREINVIFLAQQYLESLDKGWISVKDRLPEMDGYYLVCNYDVVTEARCVNSIWLFKHADVIITGVLFWKPLPEPPKEASE